MRDIDRARWPRLSPLLDELLELPPAQQAQRLQDLRAEDLELALDLAELLRREQALDQAGFLSQPVAPGLAPQPGQQVGVYRLERELGQGGMGSVWLASRTDGRYQGQVAIKFLNSGLLGQGDAGRFAREGQILARLAHPHIARLIDAGVTETPAQPYLVLEYIAGLPIDQHCREQGLDLRQRVALFLDVLAAVAHAHHRLILHRDLKPGNILVTAAGEVKLLDFGIAKLLGGDATQAGAATELTQRAGNAFTPQYAAPEQVQGGEVTMATDVYALGVLLFQLLGDEHPATAHTGSHGDTPLERLRAVVEVEAPRLSDRVRQQADGLDADASQQRRRLARALRGDLDTIVAKALKKRPAARYPHAEALADELRHWLADEPIDARPDSAWYRSAKFVRRHPWGVAATLLSVSALAGLTLLSALQARRAERAEQVALQRSAQADDLLGYMLGEFADKLRPLGRLELLAGVGDKALAHLGAAPDAQATPASRLQRAKALTVLGEVAVAKRELSAADAPLRAARAVLGEQPPDGVGAALAKDWRIAQGAAAFWLGHVRYLQRDFAPAQAAWEDYRRYSQAVLDQAPGDLDAQVELSYAQNSLGTLMLDRGDLPGAQAAFAASVQSKAEVLKHRPDDLGLRADWLDSVSWLGKVLIWRGELAAALALQQDSLAAIVRVRERAPADLSWTYREASFRQGLGFLWSRLDRPAEAGAEWQRARTLLELMLAQQPDNRDWSLLHLRTLANLASLDDAGRPAGLDALEQALTRLRGQLARPGAAPTLGLSERVVAGLSLAGQARARHDAGLARRATDLLREVDALLQAELTRRPDNLRLRNDLVQTQWTLGLLAADPVATAPAVAVCRQVLDTLAPARAQWRVHRDLTWHWVAAQQCLGADADMPAAERQAGLDWLQARDTAAR